MARVLVTGSADGLGLAAAASLLEAGHEVVVHARNRARRPALDPLVERGAQPVVADLSDAAAVRDLAGALNDAAALDAVIHNAGVYSGPDVLAVNVLAPYVLTALVRTPRRLIYLSSGMHQGGRPDAGLLSAAGGRVSYSDSKLLLTAMAFGLARRWPKRIVNVVNPGWVATKMGGPSAPDDFTEGHRTQEWLAVGEDATVTGEYWFHHAPEPPHPATRDPDFQDQVLDGLERVTGVAL